MTLFEHRVGDRGPYPPAADDQYEHERSTLDRSPIPVSAGRATPTRRVERPRHSGRRVRVAHLGQDALARALLAGGGRGDDHLAGRLLDHGRVVSPTKRSRTRPRPPRMAPPRMRVGSSAARTMASAPARLGHDRLAHRAPTHHRGGHLRLPSLLPHLLCPGEHAFRDADPVLGHPRVDRRGHRDLEHAAPRARRPRLPRRRARRRGRPTVPMMSSSSDSPGTRMLPYSASSRSRSFSHSA